MTLTPEQKEKAKPLIIEACKSAVSHFENGDFDMFWLLAGIIARGLEELDVEAYGGIAAAIMTPELYARKAVMKAQMVLEGDDPKEAGLVL